MIAGHTFADGPTGRACTSCGRLWTAIAGATKNDVGQLGIAHQGVLTDTELDQIETERERIWSAVMGVASGQ